MGKEILVPRENGGTSRVIIASFKEQLDLLIGDKKNVVIISDENILHFYSEFINSYKNIIISTGEQNKTLSSVESIYSSLLEMGCDREWFILGFGGGIVTDITGFVASTFLRGVEFGFVATTLLAQVDASVGGKNGVNFRGYKNMIGCFNQPSFVICDSELLNTLPEREFKAGLSEIIKAGAIKSSSLFEVFEQYSYSDIRNNKELLDLIIESSIKIKANVVEVDEREKGERKKLNFGHTLAHAIEKCSTSFLHGEAVAAGMIIAAGVSVKLGYITNIEFDRLVEVIKKMGLPISCDIDIKDLFFALHSDKKRDGDSVNFVVLNSLGSSSVVNIKFDHLLPLLKY